MAVGDKGKEVEIVAPSGCHDQWGGSAEIGSLGQIGVGANRLATGNDCRLRERRPDPILFV